MKFQYHPPEKPIKYRGKKEKKIQKSEDKDEENKGERTKEDKFAEVHPREREREGMSCNVERERKGGRKKLKQKFR